MKEKLDYIFSETCGWISNILIFLPIFVGVFIIRILGLGDLLSAKPVEELP
ncbi:MAG: hypothetical protein IJI14_09185 [Anaerolineaceae bacterium]|nr:hypothetical protein [Anaerolineaceae bacterium]